MRIIRAGEHIQYIPGYGISVRESGVAVATSNWWEVPGKTCVAAYQPKGAASYAASKVNLANPGTYDATDGASYPTWAAATGWTFNGSSQYLVSFQPDGTSDYTVVARVLWTSGNGFAFGSRSGTIRGPSVQPAWQTLNPAFYYGNVGIGGSSVASNNGVYAVTKAFGYYNGAESVAINSTVVPPALALFIGRLNYTTPSYYTGSIQAIAIWVGTLTTAQIQAVSTAMAAL